MRVLEQQSIRQKTATLMEDWANSRQPPFTGDTADDFQEAITAAHLIADEAKLGLHRWVDAARRSGLSWSDIGDTLGISKQAAQQRFKGLQGEDDLADRDGEKIVRLGATAFNEMAILRDEGRNGNELVDTGAFKLTFRATGGEWEYHRRIGGADMRTEMMTNGWSHVSSWMPFHYFKRRVPVE